MSESSGEYNLSEMRNVILGLKSFAYISINVQQKPFKSTCECADSGAQKSEQCGGWRINQNSDVDKHSSGGVVEGIHL